MADIILNEQASLANAPPLTDLLFVYPSAFFSLPGTPSEQSRLAAEGNPPRPATLSLIRETLAPASATEATSGVVSLASLTEVATGTNATKAVTPAGVAQAVRSIPGTVVRESLAALTGEARLDISAIKGVVPSESGASSFPELTDTPAALGTEGQVPVVNAAGDALEWSDLPTAETGQSIVTKLAGLPPAERLSVTSIAGYEAGLTRVFTDANFDGRGSAVNPLRLLSPFTPTEKAKLAGIAVGAQANVKPDWGADPSTAAGILNKPTLVTAFTGLSDTPAALGTALQSVRVNTSGNALEFYTPATGVGGGGSSPFIGVVNLISSAITFGTGSATSLGSRLTSGVQYYIEFTISSGDTASVIFTVPDAGQTINSPLYVRRPSIFSRNSNISISQPSSNSDNTTIISLAGNQVLTELREWYGPLPIEWEDIRGGPGQVFGSRAKRSVVVNSQGTGITYERVLGPEFEDTGETGLFSGERILRRFYTTGQVYYIEVGISASGIIGAITRGWVTMPAARRSATMTNIEGSATIGISQGSAISGRTRINSNNDGNNYFILAFARYHPPPTPTS